MQNWKFLDYRLPCRVDATSREYCIGWSCGSSKHRCLVISRRRGGYLWRTRCGRSKAMPMRCSSRSAATSMNCTQSPVPAVDSSGAVAQGQFVDRAVLGALGSIVLRARVRSRSLVSAAMRSWKIATACGSTRSLAAASVDLKATEALLTETEAAKAMLDRP